MSEKSTLLMFRDPNFRTWSKYIGVWRNKDSSRWYARIVTKKKIVYLGSHATEELAALAYDEAAKPLGKKMNFQD